MKLLQEHYMFLLDSRRHLLSEKKNPEQYTELLKSINEQLKDLSRQFTSFEYLRYLFTAGVKDDERSTHVEDQHQQINPGNNNSNSSETPSNESSTN